jgi:uncharacterized protein YwbE
MNNVDPKIALAIFTALGSDRIALGNIPEGTEFNIIIDADKIKGDVTRDNVAEVEAKIKGEGIDTEASIYKIASIIVVDDKAGVSYTDKKTVKRGTAELISSRELTRNGFQTLANFMKKLEVNGGIDLSKVKFRVMGHIGMVNRFSDEAVANRRLRYLPENYAGYPGYNAAMSAMTTFNLDTFRTAQDALFASKLRDGVEMDHNNLQSTIIVEVVASADAPTGTPTRGRGGKKTT